MSKTLAIVGAGRVGRALGRALRQRGWRIGAVVTRSRATARAAVRAIGGGSPLAKLTPAVLAADVLLIAVPDRAIETVARKVAKAVTRWGRLQPARGAGSKARSLKAAPLLGRVVLHTSGALSHTALASLAKLGAATGAMHPMQTFSRGAVPKLEGVVFGLDGDARALRVARAMARSLGGLPVSVCAADKAAYHTAGGFAAQHVLAVMEAGTRVLMSAGFTRRQATRALMNLARQTLDNVERLGARAAWTGPVPRGDFGTVAKHMTVLRQFPAEYREVYAALTRLVVRELSPHRRGMTKRLDQILRKR